MYSCLFEQRMENNLNETVIDMENNAQEIESQNYSTSGALGSTVVESVVESYYYPEMMLYQDVSLVNIPGSVDYSATITSETNNDNCIDDKERDDAQGTDHLGILPCGHVFHFECIFEWLKKSKNCPNCRQACSLYSVKVVKREAFQKYVYLMKLREGLIPNFSVKDEENSRVSTACYKRSISVLWLVASVTNILFNFISICGVVTNFVVFKVILISCLIVT